MFKFFKKNKEKSFAGKCLIENEISTLYDDKKYDEVVLKGSALLAEGENISLRAKQTIALSYYYLKAYNDSLILFKEIAAERNDLESWFNILMSLIPLKEELKGKEVFDRMLKMRRKTNIPELGIPFIRFYYASALNSIGSFSEAMIQLEILKKVYIALGITDDTFLYIRGVPFLSHTLDLAVKVFAGLGLELSNSSFLSELRSGIDSEGKAIIKKYC